MVLLRLSFTFLALASLISAGSVNVGGQCTQTDNRLQFGTYQFFSDCDSTTFCSSAGICERRKCRRADFPFGFQPNDTNLPEKCPRGQFCPDEEDGCQDLLAVGSACQLNRDDECLAPPNFEQLADSTSRLTNWNGSVCLKNVCMWANVTEGEACVVENTAYTAYGPEGEYIDVVSRGNCKLGLYCDSINLKCQSQKNVGDACESDKECGSSNCLSSGFCGLAVSTATHIATWVYAVVGVGIVGGMLAVLIALFFFHRRARDEEREKRAQYWREQNAFHQNLMQMREAARASILSLPRGGGSQRSTIYGDDSSLPILQHAPKPSGLRNYVDADESSVEYDDGLMMPEPRKDNRF